MKRKSCKKMKKAVTIILLLATSILLTGCGSDLKSFFLSDASMKRMAKEDLKERYGEEFVVHEVWSLSWHTYAATCSPKADDRVVFEIGAYKDGTGIYSENYGKSVVAAQISQKLEEELQEYFPNCYVNTYVSIQTGYLNVDNVRDLTMEEYAERCLRERCCVDVYVDKEALRDESIANEYQYFSETLQGEIKTGKIPNIDIVEIYYMDADQLQNCRKYFKENCQGNSSEVAEGCYEFWFGYSYEKVSKTYEEYEEMRRGGM
ncbi:MAG: hypothetical protein NC243_02835 [Lachnoclostridium sp.]|nr:hypothetical protein [Lachnoclostridium sp.]MCM1383461.1 hypothetical protein [Lachnoclostridium sp.]